MHGITPLLAAIWEGHKSCVEYLLSAVRLGNCAVESGEPAHPRAQLVPTASTRDAPLLRQGASKSGKAPDGKSYLDSAESAEIKALLK